MKMIGDISGRHFYYSSIDKLIDRCSQIEKCAIIIDEAYLEEFLTNGISLIGGCVDQIIIIGGDVNTALFRFKDKNLFLLAADNFKDAIRYVISGVGLFHEVICVPKEDEATAIEIITNMGD